MSVNIAQGSAIKLVRKSAFREDAFTSIDAKAKAVIEAAQEDQILALTITHSSPLRVAEAQIFDRELFENMLSSK